MRDDWVVRYFLEISKIHPTILYNFPLASGYDVPSTIAKRIIDEGGNLVGVKETLTDLSHMLAYKYDLGREFRVYSGPDSLILTAARSGLDGSIAGTGNYATELFVRLVREFESSDAMDMQRVLTELATLARKYGQWSANYAMTKIMRGYDVGDPRPPFYPVSDQEMEKLEQEIKSMLALPENQNSASSFKRIRP